MSAELAQVHMKLDRILGLLSSSTQPHLTRKAFAKLAGISAKTVSRKITAREIITEKGRIPHTELAKFTRKTFSP